MAGVFQIVVLYACFVILGMIAAVCAFVGLKKTGDTLRARLCPVSLIVFAIAAAIATSEAQKRGGVQGGASTLLTLPNAVTNAAWRAHGAYEAAFYIPATNWWARMQDGGWIDRLRIFSSGGFQAKGTDGGVWTNYPSPFTQKLSLAPEAHWPLLTEAASLFWHGTTPSNTLVMTWQGGLYERSHTNLVNFQVELFNDGSFDYRYADHTEHFTASLPFDLDGDGLENSVDPDPITAGPDAHGTNAEWYNTVCSNVFSAASWREGVNSNAYYFVDVVAERGPAPIYFTGDRDSRLGNPVVVALAGITNRVPLLIGIDYSVTSDTPFTVSFPVDYMYPEVQTNAPCAANVRWPLNFVFTEDIGASNRIYTVTVEPYDPGGVLEWNGSGGGVPMRGGPSNDGCECVHYGFYSCWFTCSGTCTCGMGCTAEGCYHLEDASFLVSGGQCRCGFDDPPPDSPPSSHEPDDPPSLTITFSKSAVIFEDAYEDEPGKMEPRRSTRVRLTIDAYGGQNGGSLLLTEENLGKLVVVDGDVTLPYSQELTAGESYHVSGVYEGILASDLADDVHVSGMLTGSGVDSQIAANDNVTVVRVEFTPCATAPENPSVHRHLLGIGEIVNCLQCPSSPSVTWQSASGWTVSNSLGVTVLTAPLLAVENGIFATCGGQNYSPHICVIEPEGVVAENAVAVRYGVPKGEAGGIGMKLDLYVMPRTVSFSNIAMQETPCRTGTHSGYFDNPEFADEWCHWTNHGAGEWHNIGSDNFFFEDYPRVHGAWPRMMDDGTITTNKSYGWQDGTMVWDIPIGWGPKGTTDNSGQVGVIEGYKQEFVIFSDGFAGVRKFSNQVTRRTNDVVYLNGVLKP